MKAGNKINKVIYNSLHYSNELTELAVCEERMPIHNTSPSTRPITIIAIRKAMNTMSSFACSYNDRASDVVRGGLFFEKAAPLLFLSLSRCTSVQFAFTCSQFAFATQFVTSSILCIHPALSYCFVFISR